jgi:hypothetical protein
MQGFGTIKINNEYSIEYRVVNAYMIELDYKSPHIDTTYYDNKIVKLESFNHVIRLADKLVLNYGSGTSIFKINYILPNGQNKFILQTTKPTKTKHFLMPVLGMDRKFWHYNEWLINCYLSNDLEEILLEYRFNTSDKYLEFEKEAIQVAGYCKTTEFSTYSTIFHYKIKSNLVETFVKGMYSAFPDKVKKSILSFHGFKEEGQTGQILYKSPKLREQLEIKLEAPIYKDMELYDIPLLTEEILIL